MDFHDVKIKETLSNFEQLLTEAEQSRASSCTINFNILY